ncbi:hypothetical protein BH09MYX1_BH09MYX1_65590 [soil metagenome]
MRSMRVQQQTHSLELKAAGFLFVLAAFGCGGDVTAGNDASVSDAATDAAADTKPNAKKCLPNGSPVTPQNSGCCSGYTENQICTARCTDTAGIACDPPDRPCCPDSGLTCVNGGCQ